MIITLILLGRLLESGARAKFPGQLIACSNLPGHRSAGHRGRQGQEEVQTQALAPGELILVRPGDFRWTGGWKKEAARWTRSHRGIATGFEEEPGSLVIGGDS